MSTPLSPPAAAAPVSTAAPRPSPPAAPVETARAPRPVEAGQPAADLRRDTARDKPVGPPPAFEINVLQDILTRLRDPDATSQRDPDVGRLSTAGLDDAVPLHVDKKV